jgi:hypothetical protein
MKNVSLVLLTVVGLGMLSPATQAAELSLTAAVQQGAAEVYISGRGYSTGDALQLRVRKKVAGDLTIKIEPGTVLVHTKGRCQSMVVYGVKWQWSGQTKWAACSEIVLKSGVDHTFIVEGYCRDAKLPSPKPTDYFTLAKPDEACLKVMIEGKRSACTPKIIQAAIWIARDKVQDTYLSGNFHCNRLEIDAAKSLLEVVSAEAANIVEQRQEILAGILNQLNIELQAGGAVGPGGIAIPGLPLAGGATEEAEVTADTRVVGPLGFVSVEVTKGQKFAVIDKAEGKVLVAGIVGAVPVRGWIAADKVVVRKLENAGSTPGTGAAQIQRVSEAVLEVLNKID